MTMIWSKPELVEVNMSAEIGAYQDDSGERDESPVVVADEASVAETV
jgi:hypothetical protein